MEKPNLESLSTYDKVRKACTFVLETNNKSDQWKTFSSAELFAKVQELFPETFSEGFAKNTFYQYLSNTVKDPDSMINCRGRRQGYYLAAVAEETKPAAVGEASTEEGVESEVFDGRPEESVALEFQKSRKAKESLLYPVLESWLIVQGYQSANVSMGRSLGKWGNPDVAGLSATDAFSGLSIELATIEAKTSLDGWEQWIFEAVSHRRFSNRSYFAFAHPEETVTKIPQDMRYYAELYNIGVLVLSMENDKFKALHDGRLTAPLDSEDVEVIEIFSAPYNFVQPKYQVKFCEALGINCLKDLYRWGSGV
ncbi:MAG TPA: hypothetical protein DIS96_09520 [Pusillimonas sp.]|nr:hypothetical protein [Pusillimonas sp.]|tara:strand:- start:52 stop:981 length:930 start_codon:yes stop_codon:yes gene_type:complete